jgi:hypothetical protein
MYETQQWRCVASSDLSGATHGTGPSHWPITSVSHVAEPRHAHHYQCRTTMGNLSPGPAQAPSPGKAHSPAQAHSPAPSPEQAIELEDMGSGIASAANALPMHT